MTGIVSLGSSTPGGSTTQLQYNNGGVFGGLSSLTTDGTNLTLTSASFGLSGNITGAGIIGTSGIRYKNAAATLTDTTSTGTIATGYTDIWGGNTIAASAATTVTNYYGSYFKVPVAGTNITLTNNWALGADSLIVNGNATVTGTSATTLLLSTSANSNALLQISTNASLRGYVGWSTNNSGTLGLFDNSGNARFSWSSTSSGVSIGSGDSYGFSSTAAASSTRDLFLNRAGAASLQQGATDVDTAPVAQTTRTQGALAGGTSNVAGANWTFIASPGKGTGAGGSFIFQTTPAGSSGTVVGTPTTVLTLNANTAAIFGGGVVVAQSGSLSWNGRSLLKSTSDGNVSFRNNADGADAAIATAGILASGSLTFGTASAGVTLKQGANGLCGTFVANGVTPVTVSNTNVAVTDCIIISLNTVGGTVGASAPDIKTITAGVGFTVAGVSLDTSTYNYAIIKNAA